MTQRNLRSILLVALLATLSIPETCHAMFGCMGKGAISAENVRTKNTGTGAITVSYNTVAVPEVPTRGAGAVVRGNVQTSNTGAGATTVSYSRVAPLPLPELPTEFTMPPLAQLNLEAALTQQATAHARRRHSVASSPKAPRPFVPLTLTEARSRGRSILVSPRNSRYPVKASPVTTPRAHRNVAAASPKSSSSEETFAGSPAAWDAAEEFAKSPLASRPAQKSVHWHPDVVSPGRKDLFLMSPKSAQELVMLQELRERRASNTPAGGAGTGQTVASEKKGESHSGSPVTITNLEGVTSPRGARSSIANPKIGYRGRTYSFGAVDIRTRKKSIAEERLSRINNVLHQIRNEEDLSLVLDEIERDTNATLGREMRTAAEKYARDDLAKVREARGFLDDGWSEAEVKRSLLVDYEQHRTALVSECLRCDFSAIEDTKRSAHPKVKTHTRYSV